ncbi:MAG: hypothetical protein Q7U66_17710 [Methylobacter sp.]|nr:hypothetical protein [Methylobacter sp.]
MLQPKQSKDANKNVVTVTSEDIEENVTAQGKLEPKEYVDVGGQVTGQLQKIYAQIGDNVIAGAVRSLSRIAEKQGRPVSRIIRIASEPCNFLGVMI